MRSADRRRLQRPEAALVGKLLGRSKRRCPGGTARRLAPGSGPPTGFASAPPASLKLKSLRARRGEPSEVDRKPSRARWTSGALAGQTHVPARGDYSGDDDRVNNVADLETGRAGVGRGDVRDGLRRKRAARARQLPRGPLSDHRALEVLGDRAVWLATIWTLHENHQLLVPSLVKQMLPPTRITPAPLPGPVAPAVATTAPMQAAAEQPMAATSISRLRMSVSSLEDSGPGHRGKPSTQHQYTSRTTASVSKESAR